MNLLTLGSGRRRLFAVHDPASRSGQRARAALICNPAGMEFVYAHRALRHLALRLARRGVDVLRFDYYGTGDSAGEESEVTHDGMCQDTLDAMEAIRDVAGVQRVTLIGLRLGASIAVRIASAHPELVESLVLWDSMEQVPLVTSASCRTLQLRASGTSAAVSGPDVETVIAPCCWEEAITTTGALPVGVFNRIEAWLN